MSLENAKFNALNLISAIENDAEPVHVQNELVGLGWSLGASRDITTLHPNIAVLYLLALIVRGA